MKNITGLIGLVAAEFLKEPLGFKSQKTFDFLELETEKNGNPEWRLENRCGQAAVAGDLEGGAKAVHEGG